MGKKWMKRAGCLGLVLLSFPVIAVLVTGLVWGSFIPILFFGKVVDTDGNPVPYAHVYVSFCAFPFGINIRDDTTSDSTGKFWVIGHGMAVVIMTSKTGYYSLEQKSDATFAYYAAASATGKSQWHATPSNAAIFTLRKMGETEPLISIHRYIKIQRDGTPIQMNLATGKTYQVTDGDILVEAWTHDKESPPNSRYDWRCKITVPRGGLQSRTGEFDFIAPETGYQTSDEIDMPATAPHWNDNSSRSYFLKLANGTYARIDFKMIAGGDNFFEITSYLNPATEHRNLEFDSAKQIKP